MIVFVNHDGSIALQSVSTINQGSVDANKITIVHPFSTAIVRLAFTLPNGIVLEEPRIASDSAPILSDEYRGLSVSEYTFDRELTRVAGILGGQIFFTYIDPTDIAKKRTVTITTTLNNITINNGSRFILDDEEDDGTPLGEIIAIASAAKGSAANAEASASEAKTSAANAEASASEAQESASAALDQISNTVKLDPGEDVAVQEIKSGIKVNSVESVGDIDAPKVNASEINASEAIHARKIVVRIPHSVGDGYDETIVLDPVDGYIKAMNGKFSEDVTVGGYDVATVPYVDGLVGDVAAVLAKLNRGGAV